MTRVRARASFWYVARTGASRETALPPAVLTLVLACAIVALAMNAILPPRSPAKPDPSAAASAVPGSIRLWQAIAAAHAVLTLELDADGSACPVLAAETFAVLLSLADEPGHRLRMHELAERSHVTPSGLTRRVDRLESDGLLARAGCPGDRRGAFAQLTPRGLDELRRALPHHAAVLERYVGPRLDDPGIDGLVVLLGDLAGSPRPERMAPAPTDELEPGRERAPAPVVAPGRPDPSTTGTTDRSR